MELALDILSGTGGLNIMLSLRLSFRGPWVLLDRNKLALRFQSFAGLDSGSAAGEGTSDGTATLDSIAANSGAGEGVDESV